MGTAKALFGTTLLFLPLTYGVASRILGLKLADIIRIFARPVIGATVMYFAVMKCIELVDTNDTSAHQGFMLMIAVVLGVVVYGGVIGVMWLIAGRPDGPERYFMELVNERARRLTIVDPLKRRKPTDQA